jgi:hypothetical protein
MAKPVHEMTRKELAKEVENMAAIITKDGIGHNFYSKARAIAVMREAVRRIPGDWKMPEPPHDRPS